MNRKNRRRILFCLSALIVPLAVLSAFFLRFRLYVVLSGSMEPALPVGSVVIVDTEQTEIQVGEIATFRVNGRTVTHRISEKTSGGYITKGDANQEADPRLVKPEEIIGTVEFFIPFLGYGIFWIRRYRVGMICAGILIPLASFLLSENRERKHGMKQGKIRLKKKRRKIYE